MADRIRVTSLMLVKSTARGTTRLARLWPEACALRSPPPTLRRRVRQRASARHTNVASLEVFRAILRQPCCGSGLHQPEPRLWPPLPRPRLPAPGAVADTVISDSPEHRVDQPCAIPRPRRFEFRGEGRHDLLGPFEAHLAGL